MIGEGFVQWWQKEENSAKVDHLLPFLCIQKEQREEGEQTLAGKTFVITGSLNHFPNRNALKELIECRGGKTTGSVTSRTSYLINNDTASGSSKNRKARELGIPVLSEEDFLKMLE